VDIKRSENMKLTDKDWLEIYELNKKYNKEKKLYVIDDIINNLSGKKDR
jgi:hypothetical protein